MPYAPMWHTRTAVTPVAAANVDDDLRVGNLHLYPPPPAARALSQRLTRRLLALVPPPPDFEPN